MREADRMDPITLIVTALATGASAGAIEALKDDLKNAAQAAYAKLRALARKRVAGRPDGELALQRHETAPQKWEPVLADELTQAGAADDDDLVAAAQELMKLLDGTGTRAGKYNVTIEGSQGVQVGDRNIQVNRF
jgi:RIP homotypic interaction motif